MNFRGLEVEQKERRAIGWSLLSKKACNGSSKEVRWSKGPGFKGGRTAGVSWVCPTGGESLYVVHIGTRASLSISSSQKAGLESLLKRGWGVLDVRNQYAKIGVRNKSLPVPFLWISKRREVTEALTWEGVSSSTVCMVKGKFGFREWKQVKVSVCKEKVNSNKGRGARWHVEKFLRRFDEGGHI